MKKIQKRSLEFLKKQLLTMYPFDIADMYIHGDELTQSLILDLPMDLLAQVFVELEFDDQYPFFQSLDHIRKKALFKRLESDDLKEFLSLCEEDDRLIYLALLPKIRAKAMALLLQYEDDEVASMMSLEFMTITEDMTIKEATQKVITSSKDSDYIDTLFVVDKDQKLIGIVDLKDLIIARPSDELSEIIQEEFQYVYASDSIEKAINMVTNYDRNAIPVLDEKDAIIGIVTGDDIFDEIIEDAEEEYQNLALIGDHETSLTAIERSKKRLPWLLVAVLLNLLIASFLSIFEKTLSEVIALVLFQPLILGMAGNIGTQSLAVTILGLRQTHEGESLKHHRVKEFYVGLINSLFLGVLSFGFAFGFLTIIKTGDQAPIMMAYLVFITVFSSMFISSIIGVLLPIVFNKIGINPLAASGPMMTTINDLVALVLYFSIATWMFVG